MTDAAMRALEEENRRLREAVTIAERQFLFYEQQHRAKNTSESGHKANTNRDLAAKMRWALDGAVPP